MCSCSHPIATFHDAALAAALRSSVQVLWHFFQLILRPGGDGVNVAVIVAHEVEIRQRHGDRFRANPEEAANINDRSAAVKVIHRSDLSSSAP